MKAIIITRGVSGSGKSFFAETLLSLSPEKVVICCADDFFVVDGEYRFDTSKLGQAHSFCKERFNEAVSNPKIELIIVANTNTKPSDWQYYSDCAKVENIPVIFAVIENRHGGKDSHNVPIFTLDRQANNIKMSLCP